MKATGERYLGRAPESFTFAERQEVAGKWIALKVYSPSTPERRIEAIGDTLADCVRALRDRSEDIRKYEFSRLSGL